METMAESVYKIIELVGRAQSRGRRRRRGRQPGRKSLRDLRVGDREPRHELETEGQGLPGQGQVSFKYQGASRPGGACSLAQDALPGARRPAARPAGPEAREHGLRLARRRSFFEVVRADAVVKDEERTFMRRPCRASSASRTRRPRSSWPWRAGLAWRRVALRVFTSLVDRELAPDRRSGCRAAWLVAFADARRTRTRTPRAEDRRAPPRAPPGLIDARSGPGGERIAKLKAPTQEKSKLFPGRPVRPNGSGFAAIEGATP